jgi:hypothetical protein
MMKTTLNKPTRRPLVAPSRMTKWQAPPPPRLLRKPGQRRPSVEVQHERVQKEYAKATAYRRPGGIGELVRSHEPPVMWAKPTLIDEHEYETGHTRLTPDEREKLAQETLALAQLHASVCPDRRSEQTKEREQRLASKALARWIVANPDLAGIAGLSQPLD